MDIVVEVTFCSPTCIGLKRAKGILVLKSRKLPPAHLSTTHGKGITMALFIAERQALKQGNLESGMWKRKRKQRKRLNCCGSGSTLMKEVGRGSELGSVSVEKEPEAGAFF